MTIPETVELRALLEKAPLKPPWARFREPNDPRNRALALGAINALSDLLDTIEAQAEEIAAREARIAEMGDETVAELRDAAGSDPGAPHAALMIFAATALVRQAKEIEALKEALRVVDESIRHHHRSDVIAPALIQTHAVQAIRAALKDKSVSAPGRQARP